MANPHKGEVGFEAGGKAYKLSFSANAICEMEVALKMGIGDIGRAMNAGEFRMEMWRLVFLVGLQDQHPDIDLDKTKAILKHITPAQLQMLIGEAFSLAFPPTSEGAQANGQAGEVRPTSAAPSGTGLPS